LSNHRNAMRGRYKLPHAAGIKLIKAFTISKMVYFQMKVDEHT